MMNGWNTPKTIAIVMTVLTLVVMGRFFETDLQKRKLNQRYERMIEQNGKELENLIEVIRRLRALDDRLRHSLDDYPKQK